MAFLTANLSLILALVLYGVIHLWNKWIHQQARWFILGSLLLSTLVLFVDIPFLTFMIDRGHFTLAFFILIMFAGVMKKTWIPYKKILLVRGDLAIMGFIFLLPHGIERLSLALGGYNTSGLIAAIIMIPLTISSFMSVRKNIRPDRWRKLHKLAYVAYLMIYFHLGFDVYLDASFGYVAISPNSVLFHLFFVIYLVFKFMRIREKKVKLAVS